MIGLGNHNFVNHIVIIDSSKEQQWKLKLGDKILMAKRIHTCIYAHMYYVRYCMLWICVFIF